MSLMLLISAQAQREAVEAKPVREDGMPDGYPLPIKAPQPKPIEPKTTTL
jgi:hypothetical protein